MTSDGSCPSAARDAPADSLLDTWAVALAGPDPDATLRPRLAALTDSLLSVVQGHAAPAVARAVGARLVAAGLDEPGALERTLVLLQRELAGHPRGWGGRLAAVTAHRDCGDLCRSGCDPPGQCAPGRARS